MTPKISERPGYELKAARPGGPRRWHYVGENPVPASLWQRCTTWLKDTTAHRSRLAAAKRWYESVGITPEPAAAKEPMDRSAEEQRRARIGYRAWLTENGYDPDTGYNALGVDPWRGIKGQQLPDNSINVLTGKPWAPTGFLRDGTHAKTGTPYGPDGADRDGWMRPDADGRRINVFTGTIFSPSDPAKTFNGETVEQYWLNHISWRTPEVEAQIQRDCVESEEISRRIAAELAEEERLERKIRMAQRRDSKGRYTAA